MKSQSLSDAKRGELMQRALKLGFRLIIDERPSLGRIGVHRNCRIMRLPEGDRKMQFWSKHHDKRSARHALIQMMLDLEEGRPMGNYGFHRQS